jgi:hypothetical protein
MMTRRTSRGWDGARHLLGRPRNIFPTVGLRRSRRIYASPDGVCARRRYSASDRDPVFSKRISKSD